MWVLVCVGSFKGRPREVWILSVQNWLKTFHLLQMQDQIHLNHIWYGSGFLCPRIFWNVITFDVLVRYSWNYSNFPEIYQGFWETKRKFQKNVFQSWGTIVTRGYNRKRAFLASCVFSCCCNWEQGPFAMPNSLGSFHNSMMQSFHIFSVYMFASSFQAIGILIDFVQLFGTYTECRCEILF